MLKKVVIVSLGTVGLALMVLAFCGECNEANAEVLGGIKIVCKDGKCVPAPVAPAAPDLSADLRRLHAVRRQINDTRARLNELGKPTTDMNAMDARLKDMEKQLSAMENELSKMSGQMGGLGEDTKKEIARKASILHSSLGLLANDIKKLQKEMAETSVLAKRAEARRLNLEAGLYGGVAYAFGPAGGVAANLSLPMGADSLWTLRLSGGMGVSPSLGVGWMAKGSIARSIPVLFDGDFSVGPAVLAMGDEGGLLDGSQGWVLGGGPEFRVQYKRFYASATPFVGVAMKYDQVGRWHEPQYKHTVCGDVMIRDWWFEPDGDQRTLHFSGGVVGSLGIVLF